MKKLTVGIAALLSGYAANSLAALPTGTSRCDVTVPSYCGGFTFSLTGLYWRPSSPEFDFGLSFPNTTTSVTGFTTPSFTDGHFHHVNHNYDWGWKASVGYIFPCSGNDVQLVYTNWDNDDDRTVTDFAAFFPSTISPFFVGGLFAGGVVPFVTPATVTLTGTVTVIDTGVTIPGFTFAIPAIPAGTVIDLPLTALDLTAVSARSRIENRTWDLEFGQAINVGCNFRLRWFGGLRYSRLEHELDVRHDFAVAGSVTLPTVFVSAATLLAPVGVVVTPVAVTGISVIPVFDFAATIRDVVNQRSRFDGVGPRFGIDATYAFGCSGFGVVGSLSTSLLIGEVDSTFSERIEVAGTVTATGSTVIFPSTGLAGAVAVTILGATATVTGPTVSIADPGTPVEVVSFRHPDETRVVPNIDAKLGVDWSYQFCNCSRTKLTIEAGWMVSHYFNAIDRLSDLEAFAPEVRARHTIDLSFDGPYLGVSVNL